MKSFIRLLVFFILFTVSSSAVAGKTLPVPRLSGVDLNFDGIPDESFWQRAAVIDQLNRFRTANPGSAKTQLRLCLDRKNFYIAISCDEPLEVVAGKSGASLWAGDCVELFLGKIGENDWYRQLAFGLNGQYYNEFIQKDEYQLKIHIAEKFWSAEIVIPLDKLGDLSDDKVGFNILRYRTKGREVQSWSPVYWAHDVNKFDNLQLFTPDSEITHGPWTSNISANSADIVWASAGKAKFELFLRKAGESGFRKVDVKSNGKIHHASLAGLLPGSSYEYRINNGKIRCFTTLSPAPADFSFAVTSDIHGRAHSLKRLFNDPQVKQADLFFAVGDMCTAIIGYNTLFDSFLDTVCANWNKPFYCTRGNHEYRGNAVGAFFDLLSPERRQSFGAFTHKGVFFIMLDTDGDFPAPAEYVEKQKKFLQAAVNSPEFAAAQFRVLMVHQPLFPADFAGGKDILALMSDLPQEVRNAFDLCLSGHIHSYDRMLPGNKVILSSNPNRKNGNAGDLSWTFPVLTCDSNGVFIVNKSDSEMQITVVGGKGGVIDTITVKRKLSII